MRFLLVVSALAVVISSPAFACRALWEYPQTIAQVAQMDLPASQKDEYSKVLEDGFALHERGRTAKNRDMMREAVGILDGIKIKIAK